MSDREKPQLRFRAGKFEDRLANAIAALRAWVIVMVFVVAFGLFYFVSGALGNETSSPEDYVGGIPLMIGLGIVAFLLGKLYDVE